jgi:hypothetical protein
MMKLLILKLHIEFILCIPYELYDVVKNAKGNFSYILKSFFIKAMKPAKDEISTDNKLSVNYLIDTLFNFQKRLDANECKQRKYKRKINKHMDDLYEPRVESNVEANEEAYIKFKPEELIEEPIESTSKQEL